MHYILLIIAGTTVLQSLFCYFFLERKWGRRLRALEQDLPQFSAAISEMAEIQMKSYRKLSGHLGDMEERIMDLVVPSKDSGLPLERRHQVLALSRKGVAAEDIAKRLDVPRGEAELILGLRKFVDAGAARASKAPKEGKNHVRT